MKKPLIILLFLASKLSFAQIVLSYTHTETRALTKFDYAGYKYYTINNSTQSIDIFDANNSLYRSIAVPGFSNADLSEIYLSDNLFDTDTLIEYMIYKTTTLGGFEIYNELGTLVFSEIGVSSQNLATGSFHMDIFNNYHLIFYDGVSTKMRFTRFTANGSISYYEVYELPGNIPCIECSSAPVATGIRQSKPKTPAEATFFPNPVKNELKLKYSIPPATKMAKIKVYDSSGKMISDYRISSASDYILLPSDYNNGLYLYSLEIDGQVIKNEKIILDRY